MCSGSYHHRPIGGLVDPLSFSAINFLRNYNRLVSPSELAQCYNLSLFKDSRPNRNVSLPTPVFPLHSILTPTATPSTNSPVQALSQYEDSSAQHNNIRAPSPTNRLVSSTCPPTPPEFCDSSKQNSFSALILESASLDGATLSPNFLRRQRGEKRPIPEEQKDDKYFERRKRNNEAAKKSRDARKMREDRVAFRAAMLEQENAILRAQLLSLRDELSTLRQLLCTRT